jgi:hypothetical protein
MILTASEPGTVQENQGDEVNEEHDFTRSIVGVVSFICVDVCWLIYDF